MQGNENRLVPGPGRRPDLGKLKKLAYGKPTAAGRPSAGSLSPPHTLVSPAAPRRLRRAESAWAGALSMGAVLLTVASLVLLDRGGALPTLLSGNPAPALPDAGLSLEDRAKYWTLAEYEPGRFASLLGVRPDEPARMEKDARRLERLLSEPSPRR